MDKQWKLAIKQEATRIEKHFEHQLGLIRTELLGGLRDLRLTLEGSEEEPGEKEKVSEGARKLATFGRPLAAAALTPLTEEPHQERLARLDEAIDREVTARSELDRRLRKEMADLSHQLRMAVALGVEDSGCKALQEPAGGWSKHGKDDFYNEASEGLREASESKDFGFGRLQSLLRAQQQQQQQQLLDTAAAAPAPAVPERAAPAPALPETPRGLQAPSGGLVREAEDLRKAGAVCEAVRHEALRDLLRHGSRSRGRPGQCGELGSGQ